MQKKSNNSTKLIATAATLGIAGFLAYKFWYIPNQQAALAARAAQDPNQLAAANALLQQAQELQAKNPGMSLQGAFEKIGTVGCQAVGAYYGIPPQASGGVCALAVHLGTQIGIETTKLGYKYTKKAAEAVGSAVSQGAKLALWTAPKAITEKTYDVLKYAGYTAPLELTRRTASVVSSGGRAVASGTWSGVKSVANAGETVLSKLNPTNWF